MPHERELNGITKYFALLGIRFFILVENFTFVALK
jgi:hypothetical protein